MPICALYFYTFTLINAGTDYPEPCVFPFIYGGKSRDGCIRDNNPDGTLWCSVEVDVTGHHIPSQGHWGNCDLSRCWVESRIVNSASSGRRCVTKAGGKAKAGTTCEFPFTFNRKTYTKCTTVASDDDIPWCSTKVDNNGKHIRGYWGNCDLSRCWVESRIMNSASDGGRCVTKAGGKAKAGTKCQFPFTFNRKTYTKCTTVASDDDIPWCSTKVDNNGKHIRGNWGNCHCTKSCCGEIPTPRRRPKPRRTMRTMGYY